MMGLSLRRTKADVPSRQQPVQSALQVAARNAEDERPSEIKSTDEHIAKAIASLNRARRLRNSGVAEGKVDIEGEKCKDALASARDSLGALDDRYGGSKTAELPSRVERMVLERLETINNIETLGNGIFNGGSRTGLVKGLIRTA